MSRYRRRQPHKLAPSDYIGQRTIAFTTALDDRKPYLTKPEVAVPLVQMLSNTVDRHQCSVPIYTIMPDHIHVLMKGMKEASNLKAAFEFFKWQSAMWFKANAPAAKWNRSYWDRTIRTGESWSTVARYIAHNPYRSGLIKPEQVWPFTGAIGHDLNEVLTDAFW